LSELFQKTSDYFLANQWEQVQQKSMLSHWFMISQVSVDLRMSWCFSASRVVRWPVFHQPGRYFTANL